MNWKSIFSNFVGVKSQQISDNHARMRPLAILLRFMAPHRKLLIYSPNYWFWALWLLIFCSGGWQLCISRYKFFLNTSQNAAWSKISDYPTSIYPNENKIVLCLVLINGNMECPCDWLEKKPSLDMYIKLLECALKMYEQDLICTKNLFINVIHVSYIVFCNLSILASVKK